MGFSLPSEGVVPLGRFGFSTLRVVAQLEVSKDCTPQMRSIEISRRMRFEYW